MSTQIIDTAPITPIILAGGSGTRLWPLSRVEYPKQFHAIAGDSSLLQQTILRCLGTCEKAPIVICNDEQRFLVSEQLKDIEVQAASIFLEPVARNTAPAIAIAAFEVASKSEDALMGVFPADHLIEDQIGFLQSLKLAAHAAMDTSIVLLGAKPTSASTGYGYIRTSTSTNVSDDVQILDVTEFVEKPELGVARKLLGEENVFWNTGIFVFKASTYLQLLQKLEPDIYESCHSAYLAATIDMQFTRIGEDAFAKSPSNSIDYAILEKIDSAKMVAFDNGWSDIGSWKSIYESKTRNEEGNVISGDVLTMKTSNSHIHSSSRLVAAIGVENINVVETDDCVLVTGMDQTEDTKAMVEQLKKSKRSEATSSSICYRPWGHYESLQSGARFQVKRITVKPRGKLSLQSHFHRAEHWVVVSGTALVTNGDEEVLLTENQSCYIPLGNVHRLENPGGIPLELIEVQSGSYLGEDDIVRYDDVYGRSPKSPESSVADSKGVAVGTSRC